MSDIDLPPGADPALERPRADVAYRAWELIRGLGNVITWDNGATEGDPGSWLVTTTIQVDCRASTRQRASVMADQARRLIKAMPWDVAWEGGVVADVVCTDGPRWMPDENGGPRYVARYSITHHPRQGRPS